MQQFQERDGEEDGKPGEYSCKRDVESVGLTEEDELDIVGQIGEKMFTSGRKCTFFHKISQYDANAGNPDRQHF